MSSKGLIAANAVRRAAYTKRRAAYAQQQKRLLGRNPVRRHSPYAGETELRAWAQHNVFGARDRRARLAVIHQWNYREKKKGASWGPLGPSGERFLDAMMGFRCFRTGRLDISIREICAKLRMSVQTVCGYIERLEKLGLLKKLRRSRPVENPEPGGQQVEQITNAYWFQLPPELQERVRQILEGSGKPVDQEQRERADAEAVAEMLSTLSAEDLARFRMGDTSVLANALAGLARAVDRSTGAILTTGEKPGRQDSI